MRAPQRGITLIELMVVVAIVGILAAVAVYMFTKQTKRAKSTEVNAIFAEMQVRQEQHHLERGIYATTGSDDSTLGQYLPSHGDPAGHEKTLTMPAPDHPWLDLRFNPDRNNLFCVYMTVGDDDGSDGDVGQVDNAPGYGFPSPGTGTATGAPFNLCEGAGCGGTEAPETGGYYYMLAQCDLDDDGDHSTFFGVSFTDGMAQDNPGE